MTRQTRGALLENSKIELKDACHALIQSNSSNLTKIIIDGLRMAISSSNFSLLRSLIESSTEIIKTQEGGKLLWHALDNGNIEMATILVNSGADLKVRRPDCSKRISFLHGLIYQTREQCSKAYMQLGSLMMDKGADLNARDSSGMSVLYYAIWYDSYDFAVELVRRGAFIGAYNEDHSTSVLLLALENSNKNNLLDLLVYSIDDVETRNQRAMFLAEYYIDDTAELTIIRGILDRGLPVDYINPYGWTLLNRAITLSRVDMIEFLLDYGADVNNETHFGYCPLFLAVSSTETNITTLLIERGADIHVRNRDGEYAIHRACESASSKNIQLLLRLGVDVNVTNEGGETPFSMMAFDVFSVAEFLIIRQLALLNSLGEHIQERDLFLIFSIPEAERIYKNCSRELRNIKEHKILDDISYFCFLQDSTFQLSIRMKNEDFAEICSRDMKQMLVDLFPLYYREIKLKHEIAVKRINLERDNEEFVYDIFWRFLPRLANDMIARELYINEWMNLERNFYIELHKTLFVEGK